MKSLVESCKRSKTLVKLKKMAKEIQESRSMQKLKGLSKEVHQTMDKCFIQTSSFVPLLSDALESHTFDKSLETNFLPLKQIFSLLFKRMQFNSRYLWS
jgi:hypothetical protein